ncbi:hypothetical protein CTheo_9114 [Ceratobasidium theobromae]|uniref:Uncharacterized protein n=1 Tax=Ceratobasidium theobromae TaxID=1582974 RepID=A0A5N5Q7S6_9AGAM|nr:hypothetical protein CTheo_9114 [Ceratobasidium theobromae]
MSYTSNDYYNTSDNDSRRKQGYGASKVDERGSRTEAGRNAMSHFNNAAKEVGRAAEEFDSGGGRQAVEGVGNPLAQRNEGEGDRVNPFLKPAQMLAGATQEGLKGIPGAIFEFATEQYEAHKHHGQGHSGSTSNRDQY